MHVAAIHIVSHGGDGFVALGASTLSMGNLTDYETRISGWKSSFSGESDILFYGGELSASNSSEVLLDAIGALCDCDVAASGDVTGSQSHDDRKTGLDIKSKATKIQVDRIRMSDNRFTIVKGI